MISQRLSRPDKPSSAGCRSTPHSVRPTSASNKAGVMRAVPMLRATQWGEVRIASKEKPSGGGWIRCNRGLTRSRLRPDGCHPHAGPESIRNFVSEWARE